MLFGVAANKVRLQPKSKVPAVKGWDTTAVGACGVAPARPVPLEV